MMDHSSKADAPETFDSLLRAAERILSDASGHPIHFTYVERLSEVGRRNLILRCLCFPTGELPSRYIIKKVEADSYHPEDSGSWDTQRFFNDWVGSEFLSAFGSKANHAPRFYGGHRELGFIILQDLGHHRSLVEPLLHEDADSAEQALLRYSARLGQLHADTIDQFSAFEQLFRSVNPPGNLFAPQVAELEQSIQQVQTSLDGLGIPAEAALLQELSAIAASLVDPGPFLAYIHGDPCPDNVFDTPAQLRLIDFEFGRFGHALIDATYARMIFPTCWCANRLPRVLIAQMESRYRTELVRGCSEAQEDRVFERALATICGFWLLHTLAWHLEPALQEDRSWGIASIRQRILARLEAFVLTSEEFNELPALRGTAARLLELLGKRWPESPGLPLYPAFQKT